MKFKAGDTVREISSKEKFYVVSIDYRNCIIQYECRNDNNTIFNILEGDLELVENRVNVYGSFADYNDCNKESKQDTVDRLKKELEEAQKALYKTPVVNGYGMKIVDNKMFEVIAFGCARIPYRFFKDIDCLSSGMKTSENLLVCNRSIKSITLDSGVEISIEQCEEIVEYFNKNK